MSLPKLGRKGCPPLVSLELGRTPRPRPRPRVGPGNPVEFLRNLPQPYFKRHLVCQTHAILPVVVLDGVEMRFCQQCAKFERLTAFDSGNRQVGLL